MRVGIDLTAIWRPVTGMERVAIEMTRALLRLDQENEYVLFFSEDVHPAFAGTHEWLRGMWEVTKPFRVSHPVLKSQTNLG